MKTMRWTKQKYGKKLVKPGKQKSILQLEGLNRKFPSQLINFFRFPHINFIPKFLRFTFTIMKLFLPFFLPFATRQLSLLCIKNWKEFQRSGCCGVNFSLSWDRTPYKTEEKLKNEASVSWVQYFEKKNCDFFR